MQIVTKESFIALREHIIVKFELVKAGFPGEVKNKMWSKEGVGGSPRELIVPEARDTVSHEEWSGQRGQMMLRGQESEDWKHSMDLVAWWP